MLPYVRWLPCRCSTSLLERHAGVMAVGRFAPSPTGDLHLGNLRTALIAWLCARHEGSQFFLRMEDLDRAQSSPEFERSQMDDLGQLGLDWDGEVVRQSDRFDQYESAIADLSAAGLTYPCYCSRREIREAASAPHLGLAPRGAYPGTCRNLTDAQRAERQVSGRPAALRLAGPGTQLEVQDDFMGPVSALIDDVVLRRNDGVPSYNLAVVIDDGDQGVEQVVRADDLASSAPRQRHLAGLLGLDPVRYVHVPLVLGPSGDRLAKRDGAVTLSEQMAAGHSAEEVCGWLAWSAGLADDAAPCHPRELVDEFDVSRLNPEPFQLSQADVA